jgi:myxalamid-type nonribosomal peptide synthetase MxaA
MSVIDPKDLAGLTADEKRALLKKLLQDKAARARLDLRAEADVPVPAFANPVDLERSTRPRAIFLTGATGFVGAFVLRELLDRTDAEVYCLARAGDDQAARDRIERNLQGYGIWDAKLAHRIIPMAGDLANPCFGLSEPRLRHLEATIDVIYHVAAIVNLTSKYVLLKPGNVDGTRRILELAAAGQPKTLHYLSTYAVFDSIHNMRKTFIETDEPAEWKALSNGYAESKWVAETLVRRARERGLAATIYRVGWVIGHSETGAWNKSDFIPRLIKCCTLIGMGCSLGAMTLTPVDFLTTSFVTLSLQGQYLGRTFHLSNGQRYSSDDIFEWTRAFGYRLEKVTYEAWDAAVRTLGHEISVAPMLLFLEQAAGLDVRPSDWFSNEPCYDASRTLETLAREGVACPSPDSDLMAVYLAHFIRAGYLAPPAQQAPSIGTGSPS